MFKIKSATRLALTIGMICASVVWLALSLKLVPNPNTAQLKNRVAVTKAIAVTVSSYAENRRFVELERLLGRNVAVDKDIRSIAIRKTTGNYLLAVGPHHEYWMSSFSENNYANQVKVDILASGREWGQLEITFRPVSHSLVAELLGFPYGLVLFLASALTLLTWAVLAKTFRYLNPSKVVPTRVRSALDSLASGLVLTTNDGEIAHANKAFSFIVDCEREELLGQRLENFSWKLPDGCIEFPWSKCQSLQAPVFGDIVEAGRSQGVNQKFMVNATPILAANQKLRGQLVSFEDVTALESKKAELAKIIQTVRMSRDEVERQNEKLNFLASYDPLTKCMNRRSFFGHFEQMWAEDHSNKLSIIMLDIDHFKSINDNHGHSTGDQVLSGIGEILNRVVDNKGVVCRYGGEEFAVLFGNLEFEECFEMGEKIRAEIESEPIGGLMVTTSLGISGRQFGAMDPQHMLDQADQSLYAAKRNGRNQLVRFDKCPAIVVETEELEETKDETLQTEEIEFSAVTGLLSALSFRSASTAEHSVRVADLCVAIGQSLLGNRDLYRLEIAALLHDVGKIGVPDAILNKPEKLTQAEWDIMRRHDEIGVAIVRSAFASEEIARTIERHHGCITDDENSLIESIEETVSSKILNVCDAFDSMVTVQVYRKGLSFTDAIREIRRNTPVQFDPVVVDRLMDFLQSGRYRGSHGNPNIVTSTTNHVGERHVDDLYQAISNQDLTGLEQAVSNIKRVSTPGNASAIENPEMENSSSDNDFEKLLTVADEVMELSRVTRSTFIEQKQPNPTKSPAN